MSVSFRTRLFVSATVTVLLVVGVVLATAWNRVIDVEVSRLHAGLCSEAARIAREDFGPGQLPSLEIDIARKLRLASVHDVLVQHIHGAGSPAYESHGWAEVVPASIAGWQRYEEGKGTPAVSDAAIAPPPDGQPQGRSTPRCEVATFSQAGRPWNIARENDGEATGFVAASMEASSFEIRSVLQSVLSTVFPAALLLAALAAWVQSSFLIRPVLKLRDSMRALTPTDLGTRLTAAHADLEFAELISSYNAMLERLERSFHQASRFSADAAHELKTPLTVLRGNIERLRRNEKDPEIHASLSDLLDEVSRLAAITRKLLLLSQADAGKLDLHRQTVDLSELLSELMSDAQMASDDKAIEFHIEPGLATLGDVVLLRQMFNNLVANALRYGSEDGKVSLNAVKRADTLEVRVANTCANLPQAQRNRFFERFYRGDDVQSRALEGSGLGLSLAREIARAHHGSLTLAPSAETVVVLVVCLPSR